MKNYWNVSLVLIALLCLGGLIYAQVPFVESIDAGAGQNDKEIEELLALTRSIYKDIGSPDPAMKCSLSYSVRVVARGADDSLYTTTNDVHFIGDAAHVQIESSDVSMYQDTVVGLAIMPLSREIRIFPSSPSSLETIRDESFNSSMNRFYDELFVRSTVAEHEKTGEEHELTLIPTSEFKNWYGIEQVAIRLVPSERRLVSVQATFSEGKEHESMTMEYGSLECAENLSVAGVLEEPVLARAFHSDGRLRSEYKDYTVSDLRSR